MEYLSISEAIPRPGLRLVLTAGVPGPWGEAAKAILDIKGIPYQPVMQNMGMRDPELRTWTGQESAPVAMFEEERPRTRWYEILALAERLSPNPPLVPEDERERATMFGLAHEICSEDGLGWNSRVHVLGTQARARQDDPDAAGIPADQLSNFLGRYGSSQGDPLGRMAAVLKLLAEQLRDSRAAGSRYLVGDRLSAVDIYWTAFSNILAPIEANHCPMPDSYRAMADWMNNLLGDALDPILIEHRDHILLNYFKLPMRF